jgi:UDPglucose 6-dehydrogenase
MENAMNSVSVIGLGKLGACIAACCAEKGLSVVGADVDPRTVDLVNSGKPPIFEPGLAELMERARVNLRATISIREAVAATEVTLIVVPTPSEEHGGFSLEQVAASGREIGRALAHKSGYHLIVLTSTVLPGSTEFGLLPILERESGKRCGEDFGLCYSPEFIALGTVIRDFTNPDFLLIGESDAAAGERLERFYRQVCENDAPVARMSWTNAELTKIAVNTYVTMKISFANLLAALCEELPGGDVDAVTAALGLDSRIGPRYLKGGLGYGGPCFPRDNLALAYFAKVLGQPALQVEATDAYNRTVVDRLAKLVARHLPSGGAVSILGVSYKPGSDVVEEAQGLMLAERLVADGYHVTIFDPLAQNRARSALGDRVMYASTHDMAIADADLVVISNPDPAFSTIDINEIAGRQQKLVLDIWRVHRARADKDARYLGVGLGERSDRVVRPLAKLWDVEGRRRDSADRVG